nr:hypothetical protein [Vibrio hippocampi]
MIKRTLVVLMSLVSFLSHACGLHQTTGFNLTTEPGSLMVFSNVIDARQQNRFGNLDKPDHFRLFAFRAALNTPEPLKLNFTIFEAIKGHYSLVEVQNQSRVTARDTLPTSNDLMVITELDILDALATGKISWSQAKQQGLVALSGSAVQQQRLDRWFFQLFNVATLSNQ